MEINTPYLYDQSSLTIDSQYNSMNMTSNILDQTIDSNQSFFSESIIKNPYLCCRKQFIEDQIITVSQDTRTSFLMMNFPFSKPEQTQLKKIICSFLNCQGGIAYIGIKKSKNGKKLVQLTLYSQFQKQQVLKTIRLIAESFQPNIIINKKLYSIQFIPIRHKITRQYIPGANVIKIKVNYGIRNQFYSFQENGIDHYFFRNDLEIGEKKGRQLLKSYRSIINNPLPIPQPIHSYLCQKPFIGQPLHSTKHQKRSQKKQSTPPKPPNPQPNPSSQQPIQPAKMRQSQLQSIQVQTAKKETPNDIIIITFFYVVGIQQKHLTPILAKNKIQDIMIESIKDKKLVIKVKGIHNVEIILKLFKKMQQKYKNNGLLIYQMKTQLEIIQKYKSAIELLNKNKYRFKILQNNKIKFENCKQSLQAFILLQSENYQSKFIEN